MFNEGPYGSEWHNNMLDFLGWCRSETKKCIPKGPCGQSMYTTSGAQGFDYKYPTVEIAYTAYKASLASNSETEDK